MTAVNYVKLVKQTFVEQSTKQIVKQENEKPKKACEAYKTYTKKNKINFESYK